MTTSQPPLAAEIEPVREVSLLGLADRAPWVALLEKEGLTPADCEGKAQFMLTASDSVFKGIPFREFAVSVKATATHGDPEAEGYYLVHAFNSLRVFAFVERAVFHTPYYHAAVSVETRLPASVRVTRGETPLFHAEMAADSTPRELLRDAVGGFRGPIFLPGGRLFYATIEGQTQAYAFDPTRDVAVFTPTSREPLLKGLRDSGFQGKEWQIRSSARHAKSRTVRRG